MSAEHFLSQTPARDFPKKAPSEIVRTFLIEPWPLLENALRSYLSSVPFLKVLGSATDVASAAHQLQNNEVDLIILACHLPSADCKNFIADIRARMPSCKLLVFTSPADCCSALEYYHHGAHAIVPFNTQPAEFLDTLKFTLHSNASECIVPKSFQTHLSDLEQVHSTFGTLSCREKEVFQLLANGLQNTTIARKLFISPRTVETHRARIVRKLGVESNGELIRFAIKHGLIALS